MHLLELEMTVLDLAVVRLLTVKFKFTLCLSLQSSMLEPQDGTKRCAELNIYPWDIQGARPEREREGGDTVWWSTGSSRLLGWELMGEGRKEKGERKGGRGESAILVGLHVTIHPNWFVHAPLALS